MNLIRSLLFVPAIQEAMIAKALERNADAIVLDLEDSVPPGEKERARAGVGAAIERLRSPHTEVWVRINPSQRQLAKPDLRAAAVRGLTGVMVPKVMSRNHVLYIEALLRDAESLNGVEAGSIKLMPMIESAAALLACAEIAAASPRTVALAFGAEDYCADLGVERTAAGLELQYPRSHIAVCARAAGVAAIDTIFDDFRDEAGLRADTTTARSLGFHGKLAIHPAQIATINATFRPTPESVEYARRVLAAHEEAAERGDGAVQLEGRMIDRPVAERARRVIDLATAIEAREAQSTI